MARYSRDVKRHREGKYGNLSGVFASDSGGKASSRFHTPVLLQESVDALNLGPDSIAVDATLGEGGHAEEILRRLSVRGRLIGIERDERMLANLKLSDPRLTVVEGNFRDLAAALKSLDCERVQGILADLGVSARHYQTPQWGFSFADGPLDMRLGGRGPTAADIVNGWDESKLASWLLGAGVRQGRKIAGGLVEARRQKSIVRTAELAALVKEIVGRGEVKSRPPGRGPQAHPATKVFRALREAVTGELEDLKAFIPSAGASLAPGGRLAILIYTWEEERIVRSVADCLVKGCICPPAFPVCRCGRKPTLRWVSRKGVKPTDGEVRRNLSARSARLLVMERI